MSDKSSPVHYFNSVGDHYDPEFTREISSKMLVPDRISVIGENSAQLSERSHLLSEQQKLIMNVPERILVAGGDKHIGGREPLPELRLESNLMLNPFPGVQLSTPPHVITLDEHHYPSVVEKSGESKTKSKRLFTDSDVPVDQEHQSPQGTNSTEITPHSPEEELALLRRQVKHLSRRVLTIEQDNQQRQQREIAIYSLGVIYFLLKGLIWLHKNW
ncbi:transport and Golgi organization protein 11-like [Centruroides sculpturatus]|uniref:transport and Golgi organization protein 11-like n=1 Tax=Centruroides sculpturatus TaxID=218467 RepID=UPI000C6CF17C|nr:transport and Golgi organization protein 11-like [Centruroides sculpturatus]